MAKTKTKEFWEQIAHIGMGIVVAAPVAYFAPWQACALVGLIAAIFREDAQHRPFEGWRWVSQGMWRWVDVATITFGAALIGGWI